MAETSSLSRLRELEALADSGDEAAAIEFNRLVEASDLESLCGPAGPPPLVMLREAVPTDEPDPEAEEWVAIGAFVDTICDHYSIDHALAWVAVCALHDEMREATGKPLFGGWLQQPWGASVIGQRVAERIIGSASAQIPPIPVRVH